MELGFGDHLQSLRDVDGLVFSMGQSLRDGLRHIAGKLLADQFPDHPDLDPDHTGIPLKAAGARKVFTHIQAAAEARDGRTGDLKLLQRIAGPLRLGQQKEAHFELSLYWADHFPDVDRRAVHGLKFSAALAERLAVATVAARLADIEGARAALLQPVRHQQVQSNG
ncbi:hypothetical protein [Streptomyces sp. NPDC056844]|uniref:hypothetical protein n=1 Tax=unclassified Streptomyces TaxID=2593676 RepID=UPI003697A0A8